MHSSNSSITHSLLINHNISLVQFIKDNPKLKKFVHWLLIPENQGKPRLWVKLFLNPFKHKKGRNAIIRKNTRMDVVPFRNFIIGQKTIIEDFTTINNGMGHVVIGDNSLVGISNVIIGPVAIGNHVILAQNVVLSGLNHGYEDIHTPISQQKCSTKKIIVEDECWIGANSVITAGVRIGKHAVVAAGSVVTKDVPPYSVVAGNPAKIIKQYNSASKRWEKINALTTTI